MDHSKKVSTKMFQVFVKLNGLMSTFVVSFFVYFVCTNVCYIREWDCGWMDDELRMAGFRDEKTPV